MKDKMKVQLEKQVLPLTEDLTKQLEAKEEERDEFQSSIKRYEARRAKLQSKLDSARSTESYEKLLKSEKKDPKSHMADRAKLAETELYIEDIQKLLTRIEAEIEDIKLQRTTIAWKKIHNEMALEYAKKKLDLIEAARIIEVDWANTVDAFKQANGFGRYIPDMMPTDPKYLALPMTKVSPESLVAFEPQPETEEGENITPLWAGGDQPSGPGVIGNLEAHRIDPDVGSRFLKEEGGDS